MAMSATWAAVCAFWFWRKAAALLHTSFGHDGSLLRTSTMVFTPNAAPAIVSAAPTPTIVAPTRALSARAGSGALRGPGRSGALAATAGGAGIAAAARGAGISTVRESPSGPTTTVTSKRDREGAV